MSNYFQIVLADQQDLAVDIPAENAVQGQVLQIYPKHTPPARNQVWSWSSQSGGAITTAMNENLVWDSVHGDPTPGRPIQLYHAILEGSGLDSHMQPNQNWNLDWQSDNPHDATAGYLYNGVGHNLVASLNNSVIKSKDQLAIHTKTAGAASQLWKLVELDTPSVSVDNVLNGEGGVATFYGNGFTPFGEVGIWFKGVLGHSVPYESKPGIKADANGNFVYTMVWKYLSTQQGETVYIRAHDLTSDMLTDWQWTSIFYYYN